MVSRGRCCGRSGNQISNGWDIRAWGFFALWSALVPFIRGRWRPFGAECLCLDRGRGRYLSGAVAGRYSDLGRSEEHTSELQSLMRISYAVFCLKKKNTNNSREHETATH